MPLVDSKGLAALKKAELDKAAIALAKQAEEFGAFSNSMTLEFRGEDEEADGDYIAKLIVRVEKVG